MGALASSQKVQSDRDFLRGPGAVMDQHRQRGARQESEAICSGDGESLSHGEHGQEARPVQRLQSQIRDGREHMGKTVQHNIRVQTTRALRNESHQATDDATSRQTAPAEQSQQSSPDTPSAVSERRIRDHDPRMDQTAFDVEQSLGSEADEQLTRRTRTVLSRWTPRSES